MDLQLKVYYNNTDGRWLDGEFAQSFRLGKNDVVEFKVVLVYCDDPVLYEDKEYSSYESAYELAWKALDDGLYTFKAELCGDDEIDLEVYRGANEQVLAIRSGLNG